MLHSMRPVAGRSANANDFANAKPTQKTSQHAAHTAAAHQHSLVFSSVIALLVLLHVTAGEGRTAWLGEVHSAKIRRLKVLLRSPCFRRRGGKNSERASAAKF